jgi:hypothetical protein
MSYQIFGAIFMAIVVIALVSAAWVAMHWDEYEATDEHEAHRHLEDI